MLQKTRLIFTHKKSLNSQKQAIIQLQGRGLFKFMLELWGVGM